MVQIFLRAALVGDVWVLYVLLGTSILSVAVIADRWRAFARNRSRMAELLPGLGDRLDRGDLAGARDFAAACGGVEGRVVAAGLGRAADGPATVDEEMSARLILERVDLERRLVVLGTLGNNAPFIGLFGTVLGIIKAFNDLAVSGTSGVSVVMAGISSALVATAFGIGVAIPAVIANNWYHTRLETLLANAQGAGRLVLARLKSVQERR